MADRTPNITLYTGQSPNGNKISITLEELGLPYKVRQIDMKSSEQKRPWFLEINPNGRIPAITDTLPDGKEIRIFESGSIMQYLVAEYDKDYKISFPPGTQEYYEMNSWLFFLNAGIGPMQGQANHFFRYCPEKIQYATDRYQNEVKRLYGVLDKHLADSKQDYFVANKCTIADIAHWGWVTLSFWAGVSLEEFPALHAWEERMWAREATKKGASVPQPYTFRDLTKEEMERLATAGSALVQKGMKEDAEKNAERAQNPTQNKV
ncbi:Glutathione S-transferase 2 [Taxawa tesnikishii (nom. ined.)]|nr:Glutathione S-transferase 2 [Dothideales sp. JES 119]